MVALFWLRDQASPKSRGAFEGRRFHTEAARPTIRGLIALTVLRCDPLAIALTAAASE
jgi:hypothetical protein